MNAEGGEILLDVLRRWTEKALDSPLRELASPDLTEAQLRFAQGRLSAFRDLKQILSNPADKLKRLLTEGEKREI